MSKLRLGINIDHVATLRNARKRDGRAHPEILRAAQEAIRGGADNITIHLREDRRHILDDDLAVLRAVINVPMNLEMAVTQEMKAIALKAKPHAVCLVPENRTEVTTEGGLNAAAIDNTLQPFVKELQDAGIQVSLFIDSDTRQVDAAARVGAQAIEFHLGRYSDTSGDEQKAELKKLQAAAKQAHALGLEVHAGHGLNYENVGPVAAIPEIVELNIGHFLIGEAIFIGLSEAVQRMRKIIVESRNV
jgi:pyridoxine 5-phosphate synthase